MSQRLRTEAIRWRGARVWVLWGCMGGLLLLGAAAALGAQGAVEWRLDDFTRSYPPNEVYGQWSARKFAPLLGNGDDYLFRFVHESATEHYIQLRSGRNNSFSLGLEAPFRLQEWPVWEWEWRIVRLPRGGDVRVKDRDDQAGSVCVIVNPGLTGFESLCYLFENEGPKDAPLTSTKRGDSRYLIVRTAAADPVRAWLHERRNVLQDYRRVFGKEPQHDAVFGFQIDSDDTHSGAEVNYRNVVLRKK
jgi:hypothetical protein